VFCCAMFRQFAYSPPNRRQRIYCVALEGDKRPVLGADGQAFRASGYAV
jgi:hypothetical protein